MRRLLDGLHARLIANRFLVLTTAIVRVLLALAFLPSGWVKATGQRFTTLPVTDPVGYFFDGFFSAAGYYRFVGFAQLTAALLMLLPWTAHLGAAIYLPIILNIFVITLSVGFGGTSAIAGLMLLGCLYLLCWEYDRWKWLLPRANDRHLGLAPTLGFAAAAVLGLASVTRLHLARLRSQDMGAPTILLLIAIGGALLLTMGVRAARGRRTCEANRSGSIVISPPVASWLAR